MFLFYFNTASKSLYYLNNNFIKHMRHKAIHTFNVDDLYMFTEMYAFILRLVRRTVKSLKFN